MRYLCSKRFLQLRVFIHAQTKTGISELFIKQCEKLKELKIFPRQQPRKFFCKIFNLILHSLCFLRAHQKKTGHHNLARKVKKSRSELTIKQEGTASCYFKSPVPDIPCVTQTGYNNRNKKGTVLKTLQVVKRTRHSNSQLLRQQSPKRR